MDLDTRRRGGGGGGSNTMGDYCAQGFLQIRPNKILIVCEYMNVTEKIIIASIFHLLSWNSPKLVKETLDRKNFINTTNYVNNIYLDKLFALLVLNRRIKQKIVGCFETILAFAVAKIGISTSESRSWKLIFKIDTFMTLGNIHKKLAKVNQKLGWREGFTKSRCQLDTKKILESSPWRHEKT